MGFAFSLNAVQRQARRNTFAFCGTAVWLVASTAAASGPQTATLQTPAKVDRVIAQYLAAEPQTGWVSVIARVATPDVMAQRRLALGPSTDVRELGAYIYRHLPIARAVAVRVPRRSLARFVALSWIDHVSADLDTRKQDDFTVGGSGANIAFGSYGLSGNGVTVAILDSGISPVDDLKTVSAGSLGNTRIVVTKDFVKTDNKNPVDECGHGTHVAGIVAGNGFDSTGSDYFRTFTGVAPRATLANVRVLDKAGTAPVSRVIAGLQWIVDNASTYKIRVVNIALGHPVVESYTTDPLCQAVEEAWKAGIVVVCAAGNDGRLNETANFTLDNSGFGTAYGSIRSPGNSPYALTVGAMKPGNVLAAGYDVSSRTSDRIASYSGRGPTRIDFVAKPDIVAPGNRIISTQPGSSSQLENLQVTHLRRSVYSNNATSKSLSNDYYLLSGTSMAAPVVAGAAALLLEQNPRLSPDTVKARLMLSADKWVLENGKAAPFTFGAGYLDIPAALQNTVVVPTSRSALSPSVKITDTGFVFVFPDRSVWGNGLLGSGLWGTGIQDARFIWGPQAVTFNGVDGTGILWGLGNDVKLKAFALSIGAIGASGGAGNVDLSSVVLSGE